ncbi:protoporphyrinogen oxidase [Porphyromonas gingivalis]|uniref:protoporphyrinogen oxidase n=1 Tax=Porphyromonas gingivalis TaxID=837 RepID=UPI00097CDDD2|nr:protoporphyrinogen oxidase [Porphyromonas gingivalis]SJM17475.1 protoporphyrinogen oxidase [Porphyromonas gingivalis]
MDHLTVIIGAGLTGLTTAAFLRAAGRPVLVLERAAHIGGQIRTYRENGFVFETGPNTGTISSPEVAELFELLGLEPEIATPAASNRLIWKGNKLYPLPRNIAEAVGTPLFSLWDKWRILGEPFRRRGGQPNETVGALARRRLGKSFVDYAVDPFLGGIYAGDPDQLVTRFALPKLYDLEQRYGSFVLGAVRKARQPQSERDRKASRKVFSIQGGLGLLVEALADYIGREHILTETQIRYINHPGAHTFGLTYTDASEEEHTIPCRHLVSTVAAHHIPTLFDHFPADESAVFEQLYYAPMIEVAVGFRRNVATHLPAFGCLIPSKENRRILGILFPSDCFRGRAPEGGALYSIFMGGVRNASLIDLSDEEISTIAMEELRDMLHMPHTCKPDLLHISRHRHAIPQYYADTELRQDIIRRMEMRWPGLHLGGNMHGGIGMAHRISQGVEMARSIIEETAIAERSARG